MRDSVVVRSLICNRKRSGPMIALWIQNYLGNVVLIKNIASLDKFHYLTMIDEFKIHLTKLHKRRMSLVAWDEHLFNLRWPSFVFIAHDFLCLISSLANFHCRIITKWIILSFWIPINTNKLITYLIFANKKCQQMECYF